MTEEEDELKTEVRGGVGCILLNRPKKLNCLSLAMIRKMTKTVKEWNQKNSGVQVVVVRGAGRAFCSGGDVVSLYKGDAELQATYLKEEYALDLAIHKLAVPYVSIMDGITMGGGCGISVNGRYRVATKRTVVAMPECSIGLVPDVGAAHFLGKLENHLGLFLGLTGYRLEGRDVLSCGLATHYFSSKAGWDGLEKLEEELGKVASNPEGCSTSEIRSVLDRLFETKKSRLSFNSNIEMINQIFGLSKLGDIMESLEAMGYQAGEETQVLRDSLARMKGFSPTSLALTFHHLRDKADKTIPSLEESLSEEQRMQQRCLAAPDFKEGIRCNLLEKDKGLKPLWNPSTLKQANKEHLSTYFRPVPPSLALKQDGQAAWALALGMQESEYQLAKQGMVAGQVY